MLAQRHWTSVLRSLAPMCCALLCVLWLAPAIYAKPTIQHIDAGWSNTMPMGTWAPVRVTVREDNAPSAGRMVITVQSATSNRVIFEGVRPFAASPGNDVTFEVPVRLPLGAMPYWDGEGYVLRVRLESPTFRVYDKWTSRPRGQDYSTVMFDEQMSERAVTLIVTDPAAPMIRLPDDSLSAAQQFIDDEGTESAALFRQWQQTRLEVVNHLKLPRSWRLLSSARTVLIETSTLPNITGSRRDALLRYVADGGMLVLTGDALLIDASIRPRDAYEIDASIATEDGTPIPRTMWAHGLGWIAHLPEMPTTNLADGAEPLKHWLDVLGVEQDAQVTDVVPRYYYQQASEPGERVVGRIFDSFGDIQPPSVWWLLAFTILIALLLGPVDRFVLKRRKMLHRSWATAMVWIAIASVAAAFTPGLFRSGDPMVGVIETVDVGFDGTVASERTVVMLSGGRHRANFAPDDGADRSWQHPMTGTARSSGFTNPRTLLGERAALTPIGMRPLTTLAMQEVGEDDGGIDVSLHIGDDGRAEVRVNSERSCRVLAAAVWIEDEIVHAADMTGAQASLDATEHTLRLGNHRTTYMKTADYFPLHAPASRQRLISATRLIAEGAFAMVRLTLTIDNDTIRGAPEDAVTQTHAVHVRVVLPIDDAMRTALTTR